MEQEVCCRPSIRVLQALQVIPRLFLSLGFATFPQQKFADFMDFPIPLIGALLFFGSIAGWCVSVEFFSNTIYLASLQV